MKTQVESHVLFAQDATKCLCNQKDIQQEDDSSPMLTANFNASKEVGHAAQGVGGALAVLSPRPGLDHSGLNTAQQNTMMISGEERGLIVCDPTIFKDPGFENGDFPLQPSRDCTRITEIQQMSCVLANEVLDYPSLKQTWSWNATENSPARKSQQDFTARGFGDSTVDTRIHFPKSPEREGKRSIRHSDLQEHMLRPYGYEADSKQAINKDRSEAMSSIESMTGESLTSSSSFPEAHYSYKAEHTASQEDHSPRRTTVVTPQQSYVSLSQNFPASSREELTKTEELLSQESADDEKLAKKRPARMRRVIRAENVAIRDKLTETLQAEQAKLERESIIAEYSARQAAMEKETAIEEAAKVAAEKEALLNIAKKAREEAEEKAAVELAQKTSAPVSFQDAIGRKFACPWHLCRTWEVGGVRSLIRNSGTNQCREWQISLRKSALA